MNKIKSAIERKGIEELRPTEHILADLDIKINTWNKWVQNTQDPELWQLPIIADFLGCEVIDLIDTSLPVKA